MYTIQAKLRRVLWGALLVLLPITSLPLLAKFAGGATVNPASAIPLFFLVFIWLIPFLWRKGKIDISSSPLFIFILWAGISCALAYFLVVIPYKGQKVPSREIKALITLFTGLCFYIVTMSIIQDRKDLLKTIKLINIGALVMFFWAFVQSFFILFMDGQYPPIIHTIHRWFSIRSLWGERVSGLAYEPSWLANQLSLLYFPLWFGHLLSGKSAYRTRVWKIPLEVFLLICGVAMIFLAHSRIGLASLMAIFGFLTVIVAIKLSIFVRNFMRRKWSIGSPIKQKVAVYGSLVLLWLVMIVFFLIIAVSAVYLASQFDWRLQRVFSTGVINTIIKDVSSFFSYEVTRALKFAERTAYWDAGLQIFNENPIFGVGLGNAGFFFLDRIPTYGWRAPEVVEAIRPSSSIFPNIKNLWIRLMAETGIVGFLLFSIWVILNFLIGLRLIQSRNHFSITIGFAGMFSVIALIVEGFSVDTFGLPYFWVLFGLVAACERISIQQDQGTS